MKQKLEQRVTELKSEYEAGQKLQATLLRISGAIQVLEEMLQVPDEAQPAPDKPAGE
jgi:hypothetical protein